MAKKPDISQKLIDAAFNLTKDKRWRHISMVNIANHAEIPLSEALSVFYNKDALLNAVMGKADQATLGECANFQEDDSIKDKLFALLMTRFDYLAPHRQAVKAIVKDTLCSPLHVACQIPRILQSTTLMLEAAGIQSSGPFGLIKANGLALVFASTLRVWLSDDSEDLGPTMASLDKGLGKADKLAQRLPF
ncbi:MAG: hypothetical protein HON65_16885 [Rhodospirillales bacterium]|jgi:ubiquinone biosynthesis protein COQ9|nr:hypothetical protein [Rhodospirillales bacterium]